MTRRTAKRFPGEGLHLHLISGDTIRMRRFEVARAMIHPRILALYAVMWVVLVLADPSGQAGSPPFSVRLAQYAVGVWAVWIGFLGIITGYEALFGSKDRIVALPDWPVVLAVSVLGLAASEAVVVGMLQELRITARVFAVLAVFYFVIIQINIQVLNWLILPRVLADLRKDTPCAGGGNEPCDDNAAAVLRAGGKTVDLGALLHIAAQGNYVTIVTDDSQYEVPGPFSALLEQIPQQLGLRVHRSHWVARRAVVAHRRRGREMLLDLTYGGVATVALPRQEAVLDWLAVPVLAGDVTGADQPTQADAAKPDAAPRPKRSRPQR